MIRRVFLCSTVICLTSIPLWASDHYVDVVNGNDANAGSTPATAWKTLTHASTAAPAGSIELIHVAPGTYSNASGEAFPLVFHFQTIISDQGALATVIDGNGTLQVLVQSTSTVQGPPNGFTLLSGFTLQNAGAAVGVSSSWSQLTAHVSDCRITNMSTAGFQFSGSNPTGGANFQVVLERDVLENMPLGIDASEFRSVSTLTITDCAIRGCSIRGLSAGSAPNSSLIQIAVTRCRFENNPGTGVAGFVSVGGALNFTFDDCLFAHDGVGFAGSANPNGINATFRRCTVADNTAAGLDFTSILGTVRGTVVHGNHPDLIGSPSISYSSTNGLDPLFVDRSGGDYRLRFGSPCIDAGDPATNAGALDLALVARSIDGDLDTHERADIGAFEFQPLRLVTSAHIGTPVRLEMSGETGGSTIVYFQRSAPVSPMTTPFGEFDLDPATFGTLLHSNVAPFPPVAFQRQIPNNPFLVGRTFSFQALTTSGAAPQGSAYTNVVRFTVLP